MNRHIAIATLLACGALLLTTMACWNADEDDTDTNAAHPQETAPDDERPEAPPGTVTGTLTYNSRISLSPNAVVEIKLQDVTWIDAPAVTIAEQIITNPGQVPIAFEIEYAPSEIDERSRYALLARITEEDRLLFINDTAYEVITNGKPTRVNMILVNAQ